MSYKELPSLLISQSAFGSSTCLALLCYIAFSVALALIGLDAVYNGRKSPGL